MSETVRVVSPFSLASSAEAQRLRAAAGRPLSAHLIHGWLTAEYLAEAVRRSGAATAPELTAALSNMRGFEDGFAAPFEERPRTHSRTPEAIVLKPSGTGFVAESPFVRDRF